MKHKHSLIIGLLAVLLSGGPVWAQGGVNSPGAYLNSTTLNGSISATQTTLVLTSASALTGSSFGAPSAGQCLYIDYELMTIVSMSSTTATVRRGTLHRSTHATLAVVVTGPCAQFKAANPPNIGGNQDCSLYTLPWINTTTGDSWWCELSAGGAAFPISTWSVTNTVTRNGSGGSRRVAQ